MFRAAGYLKIPTSDFDLVDSIPAVLTVDLFYEAVPGRIQKLAPKGAPSSSVPVFLKSRLEWIFLKKEDYRTYVGLSLSSGDLHNEPSFFDVSKRHMTLMQKIEKFIHKWKAQGLRSKYLDTVLNTISNSLYFALENSILAKLLERIETLEHPDFHSLTVVIWSQLIARQSGWTGEAIGSRVILCALFHDVGLNENVYPLVKKTAAERTNQDTRMIESHALRGRDILKSIPGIPDEMVKVAHQHHELVNGTGYPQKLLLDEIHPIARLIAMTNRFHEIHAHLESDAEKNSLTEAFLVLQKDSMHFDLKFLKSLEEILPIEATK